MHEILFYQANCHWCIIIERARFIEVIRFYIPAKYIWVKSISSSNHASSPVISRDFPQNTNASEIKCSASILADIRLRWSEIGNSNRFRGLTGAKEKIRAQFLAFSTTNNWWIFSFRLSVYSVTVLIFCSGTSYCSIIAQLLAMFFRVSFLPCFVFYGIFTVRSSNLVNFILFIYTSTEQLKYKKYFMRRELKLKLNEGYRFHVYISVETGTTVCERGALSRIILC